MLSNVDLYYAPPSCIDGNRIRVSGDEFRHAVKVMRYANGDIVFVTDGKGNIYKSGITNILNNEIELETIEKTYYPDTLKNFTVCVPRLKNPSRLEFALEKSVEFGFTKFIVFESERTVAKGEKLKRWRKILLSAMKQSLRSHLPEIKYESSLNNLEINITKIVFDQSAGLPFLKFLEKVDRGKKFYLLFGPEGGFSEREVENMENKVQVKLNLNRLRSETAIISAAALLSNFWES